MTDTTKEIDPMTITAEEAAKLKEKNRNRNESRLIDEINKRIGESIYRASSDGKSILSIYGVYHEAATRQGISLPQLTSYEKKATILNNVLSGLRDRGFNATWYPENDEITISLPE